MDRWIRQPRCAAAARRAVAIGLLLLLAACGGDQGRERIEALVEAGQWDEVRSEATRLRQDGVAAAWLDFAEGRAALALSDEQEARRHFSDALDRDPGLGPEIGALWAEASLADYEAGWRDRARSRMAEALLADPSIDAGPVLPAVADYMYRHLKNYDAAWPLYERLVRERPEPHGRIPEWLYRWGHLHERRGERDTARALYEQFLEEFPDDRKQGRYARWRYMEVLMEEARERRAAGDLEGALATLELTRQADWHPDQQGRARYLAGEILEELGRIEEAREQYAEAVELGKITEVDETGLAKTRLEALDVQGQR